MLKAKNKINNIKALVNLISKPYVIKTYLVQQGVVLPFFRRGGCFFVVFFVDAGLGLTEMQKHSLHYKII